MSSCFICNIANTIGQILLNLLMLCDHIGNTLTLGDPNETMSARAGRARAAGRVWAKWFCTFLTGCAKLVTLGRYSQDHCTASMDGRIKPLGREIWSWARSSINVPAMSEVRIWQEEDNTTLT